MITTRQLSYLEIPEMIEEFYNRDIPFLTKYHRLAEDGKEACIRDTVGILLNENIVYGVFESGHLIAYFSHNYKSNTPMLGGFFVDIDSRNKEFLKEFSNIIKDSFDTNFISCIYNKNYPAYRFIQKAGGEIVDGDSKYTLFVFQK